MNTVLMHFYNEEYLLPFWLEHHKKIFDHGILIDYHSTDKSLEIINDIVPHWTIVKSRNDMFGAQDVDNEVMDIEKHVSGFKICLNVTEFLLPNMPLADILKENVYKIKQYISCDEQQTSDPQNLQEFISGLKFGSIDKGYGHRFMHSLESEYSYTPGRHGLYCNFTINETDDIYIAHCRFYPWNRKAIDRKLQIGPKIPEYQKPLKWGHQHLWNEAEMEEKRLEYTQSCYNLTSDINIRKCFEYNENN